MNRQVIECDDHSVILHSDIKEDHLRPDICNMRRAGSDVNVTSKLEAIPPVQAVIENLVPVLRPVFRAETFLSEKP